MSLLTEFGKEIQTQPRPWCGSCGGQMVLRIPKPDQTWQAFWGCSDFRDGCNGSRNIDPHTGDPEHRVQEWIQGVSVSE